MTVINLREEMEKRKTIVSTCPQCGSQEWFIHVDKLEIYDNILGFECAGDDCDFYVYLQKIKVLTPEEVEDGE